MEYRIRLQGPTLPDAAGMPGFDAIGINAPHTRSSEECLHFRIHLFWTQEPKFDRQLASARTEPVDADPGIGEVPHPASANHNSAPVESALPRRDPLNGRIAGRARLVDIQWLPVEGVAPGCGDTFVGSSPLA